MTDEPKKLTFRRLVGLDRSGPPPPATLSDAPLNPWTIPNAIGYVRIALIPVFLIVALNGSGFWPAALFFIIAIGDYADGIAARITGQYSRLGAMMDPITDRLLIASGVIACWVNDYLPHWALAVLIARELFMLVAGSIAVKKGVEVQINWPGRIGVFPLMGSIFLGLCGAYLLGSTFLYIGLVFAIWATVLYMQRARSDLRELQVTSLSGRLPPEEGSLPLKKR